MANEAQEETKAAEEHVAEEPSQQADKSQSDKVHTDEKDEKKDADSAQDKASDPENARKWRSFSTEMDAALRALVGGGTANVFFGDTVVGSLGDRYLTPGTSGHLGFVVRSGLVPRPVLDGIRDCYVEPGNYYDVRRRLARDHLVLLRARAGTGRTTTALRLLDDTCTEGVRKLDPDARLKALREQDLAANHGYLMESLEPEQALELQSYHTEQLAQLMADKGCRLVVVIDATTSLRLSEVGHLVVDDIGAIEPAVLLRRHVTWSLQGSARAADGAAVLDRDEVREIVDQLTDDVPRRELAELAALLVEVARERIDVEVVKERYSRTSQSSFIEWFDQQQEIEQRAFVIALSVFNNEPVQLVAAAAEMLAERIKVVEVPRRMDRARPVFERPLHGRLADARAELVDGTEETPFGTVPVKRARFRDARLPLRVLEHLVAEYDQALDIVLKWLHDLGGTRGAGVRIRAGMAVGLLSLYDFTSVSSVIEVWAQSGDEDERKAAVAALQIPGQHPAFARVVYRLLRTWIRHPATQGELWNRRVTAAQALGSTTAMSPGAALQQLRYAARKADWTMAYTIGESISELFCRVDDASQVLQALVRWTDEDEHPKRRETALLSVLIVSCYVVVNVDKSTEKWPIFIWMADRVSANRDDILTLFARMLQAAEFMRRGYLEIRRWVKIAQRDTTLREPLAQLLLDIGEKSKELPSIRYYLQYWASERGGPADAARALLSFFDEKGA